jgi:hypothetical protein
MKAQIQQILLEGISTDKHPVLMADTVKAKLIPIINQLMDSSFMNFVQTLYELDIDENKIMTITNDGAINAAQIADLIIEREKKKMETRRLWKKETSGIDKDLLL